MEPTLQVNDRVLVVKNTFIDTDITTGDIVVFYGPQTQFDENYYDQFIESLQIWKLTNDQTYLNTALIKRVVGPGDTVKVNVKVSEGNRERIQTFEGVIIAINGVGVNKTITVRKLSFGVGVERIFPVHAPIVDSIEVIRKGKVRRSKLYYLRDRVGKSAKIKDCLLYTSPSPRDRSLSRMPSSA